MRKLFTSESVTEGHPDKLCDYISDSILDACLEQDENSRVAVETFASKNLITIAGQITTNAKIDVEKMLEAYSTGGKVSIINIEKDLEKIKDVINVAKDNIVYLKLKLRG